MTKHDPTRIKLSASTTVAEYRSLETAQNPDRKAIADFIVERFTERYLAPLSVRSNKKHGFTIMAVGCLMIEALESFRQGWPDTNGKGMSRLAFCSFFGFWPAFRKFSPISGDFYKHVRCGILHQAETTGGWLIHKSGPILDATKPSINARAFLAALKRVLQQYHQNLVTAKWDDELWTNLRTKMDRICENSQG